MADKNSTTLIVDDDKAVIEQLLTHFRRRNYEPIATANPAIVEQTLETFQVDLILLDLRMERLNGYDILKKLKRKNVKIPVFIITAYYQDEKNRLEKIGFTHADVIEKPFRDFTKIEAAINRKLNRIPVPGEVGSDYEDEIYYGNKTKVVLVEDETELNDVFKEILEAGKYYLKVFTRGDEALKYLLHNECHVAIIDMKIPGLSGEKVIQKALQAKPALRVIPVSAAYPPEVKDLLTRVGFNPNRLITKPFEITSLIEQIKVLATEAGTLGAR